MSHEKIPQHSVCFSHMIFYVKNIPQQLSFYEKAFGIMPKFVHESNLYAELDTGATVIAFAGELLGDANLPNGYIHHDSSRPPLGCEITFTVHDIQKAYNKAITAGAVALAKPQEKPWGQIIAYIRDPEGILIELASPIK